MFFKELACLYCLVINVHLLCLSISCFTAFTYYHVLFCLSTTFLIYFALSKKALKQTVILLLFRCRVQQPRLIYTLYLTKVNTIFKYFQEMTLCTKSTISLSFFVHFAHALWYREALEYLTDSEGFFIH